MSVALEDWYSAVAPFVAGCPEQTIVDRLREGARQFARDTRVWTHYVGSTELEVPNGDDDDDAIVLIVPTPIDARNPEAARDFTIPDESTIVSIARARLAAPDAQIPYDTKEGEDGAQSEFLANGTDYDVDTHEYSIERDRNYYGNRRQFEQGGVFELWATLQPSSNAKTIPDTLAEYQTAIRDWALWELLRMPKNPWFDRRGSQDSMAAYNLKVSEAITRKAKARTNRPLRVEHRLFV